MMLSNRLDSVRSHLKSYPFIYSTLSALRVKWLNYFDEYGELSRFYRQFMSQYSHQDKLQFETRRIAASKLKLRASNQIIDFVNKLEAEGYAFTTFEQLGINSDSALEYIKQVVADFKQKEQDESLYAHYDSGKYAGKALSYHLYEKSRDILANDPFMKLALDETIIQIASMYLGYLPILDFSSIVFTPVHNHPQFGAQLWHKDLHHRRSLKIFFSPFELTPENGPFEFFPPRLSTLKHYKYAPQSMTDEQLKKTGLDPKDCLRCLGTAGQVLFVDTARCLHRGGRTQKSRYMATMTYLSPQHSFRSKEFLKSGHYDLSFGLHENENIELIRRHG